MQVWTKAVLMALMFSSTVAGVLVLLAKLFLAPLCVAGASLASRRWGPRVGGLIGGLPVVGGPILLVVTLQHGRVFGASSAAAAIAGMLALSAFVVTYGRLAPRCAPALCVIAGWIAYLGVVVLLSGVHIPRGVAWVLTCTGFAVAAWLLPDVPDAEDDPPAPPAWDIPARMTAALVLVLVISGVSSALGAHVTGLLAPFPIITAVLAAFTHGHAGVAQVITLFRGFLVGFYAYAMFNFVVSLALPDWSIGAAFGAAVVATALVQVVVVSALSVRRDRVAV
jgi:hypothetical protein